MAIAANPDRIAAMMSLLRSPIMSNIPAALLLLELRTRIWQARFTDFIANIEILKIRSSGAKIAEDCPAGGK